MDLLTLLLSVILFIVISLAVWGFFFLAFKSLLFSSFILGVSYGLISGLLVFAITHLLWVSIITGAVVCVIVVKKVIDVDK